jgi:hypothetical protein
LIGNWSGKLPEVRYSELNKSLPAMNAISDASPLLSPYSLSIDPIGPGPQKSFPRGGGKTEKNQVG